MRLTGLEADQIVTIVAEVKAMPDLPHPKLDLRLPSNG